MLNKSPLKYCMDTNFFAHASNKYFILNNLSQSGVAEVYRLMYRREPERLKNGPTQQTWGLATSYDIRQTMAVYANIAVDHRHLSAHYASI